jgi:hypothetical protein
MDDELIGQMREITGETFATCDLCGKPTASSTIVVMERRSSGSPEAEARVCPDCLRRLEADELPVGPDPDIAIKE